MSDRPMYYDRKGNVIDWKEAAKIDKRVALDTLPGGIVVSTVWLGIDHNYFGGAPLIFETMVFPGAGDFTDLDCDRYVNEKQAIEGHAAMVAKWSKPDAVR